MRFLFLGAGALLLAAEFVSWFWFQEQDQELAELRPRPQVRGASLHEQRANDVLSFDEGATYFSDRGGQVELVVLSWAAGNSQGLMDAFGHSPDVCLPVSGARLLTTLPTRELELDGQRFEVEGWLFSHPVFNKRIHAFKFVRSSHASLPALALEQELIAARWLLFRERRLMPPIEIAIGIVQGTDDPEAAWRRFSRFTQENFTFKQT